MAARSTTKSARRREAAAVGSHAFVLAEELGIRTAIVLGDELRPAVMGAHRSTVRVIWLVREGHEAPRSRSDDQKLAIPSAGLTRMSQINLGLYAATLRGMVEVDERVLCLSGIAGSGQLDLILVTQPNRDFPWLRKQDLERTKDLVTPREFGRVLELALRFAAEGREGKAIGTIFVLGPMEQLEPFTRQLILNPCEGHPRRARSVHNAEFVESLREFSALDGAMIVDSSGVVQSVGTYLDAPTRGIGLRPGLGARHAAAAAITKSTDAIAITVSESSGTVTLFDNGKPVLELERPR